MFGAGESEDTECEKAYLYIKEKISYFKSNKFISETKSSSPIDEIKKLKELLDIGAITQEEFDIKKKQLLDIK